MDLARSERFLAALEPSIAAALAQRPELELSQLLTQHCEQVLAAFAEVSGFVWEPELFEQSLAHALDSADELGTGKLAVEDLYLAAACMRADAWALRHLDARCGPELDRAVQRSPTLGWSEQEFRQFIWVRLFVGPEGAKPKLLSYRGRGSLRAWMRVMAARAIIDLSRRKVEPSAGDDALIDHLRNRDDPELDYLSHAYGPLLRGAFEQAVAALTVRQRNLLRQRYLHEVPVDALTKIYAVHRSTLYVWIEQARAALLDHARVALAAGVPGDRLDSVIAMLGSQLQVSVGRMLDSQLEADDDT